MNINDSSDWTTVILWLLMGLILASSMTVLFWASMRSYYKVKLCRKEDLPVPFNLEVSSMPSMRVISFFCIPFGIWLTMVTIVAMIAPGLTQDHAFAIANVMTPYFSIPLVSSMWVLGYQGAIVHVLESKNRRITRQLERVANS